MEKQQVAERYAHGLFELTQQSNNTESVYRDFTDLATVLKQDESLIHFLAAPQIMDSDKAAVVAKVFKGKVPDQLYHLLELLVAKRRTDFMAEIAAAYSRLYHDSRGLVETRLITAIPMTAEEIGGIRSRLNKLTGKTVEIATEVNADIIGGVIAFIGEKIIDCSIRHELQILREQLLELKVH
jgi:F-type H+-transporting ATPase subunit delta